jgi:DNA segregation ATPase FtsK/SpoIIIE-like protein
MPCKKYHNGSLVEVVGYQEDALCSSFNKTKNGNIFNFERPAFKSNIHNLNFNAQQIPKDKRAGLGNYDITRHNFNAPEIQPRMALDFDKIQAIDIENFGSKIQLSEKTIEELFHTRIPDNQDTQWLREKARLIVVYQARGLTPQQIELELNNNKPLGREQRTIKSHQNIGQSALSMADKLYEIKQEIEEGRAESRTQQAILTGQLSLVLNDITALSNLTQSQVINMTVIISRLNLPTTHQQFGLIPRFVDIDYYNNNTGMINLLLLANVMGDNLYNQGKGPITFNTPVHIFANKTATKLTSMISGLGRLDTKRLFLDLELRGTITYNDMIKIIAATKPGDTSIEINPDYLIIPNPLKQQPPQPPQPQPPQPLQPQPPQPLPPQPQPQPPQPPKPQPPQPQPPQPPKKPKPRIVKIP